MTVSTPGPIRSPTQRAVSHVHHTGALTVLNGVVVMERHREGALVQHRRLSLGFGKLLEVLLSEIRNTDRLG